MGLDISIIANNNNDIDEGFDFYKHSLSRTFCNFMCRKDVVEHEPELDQIAKISGVDIAPLYEMENYPDDEAIEFFLENAESKEEKQSIIDKATNDRQNLTGNIDRVHKTITDLITALDNIPDLPQLLIATDFDTLDNATYFSNFQSDTGDGYIGNNFGQDLRNFNRFLENAKANGTGTVWFYYV